MIEEELERDQKHEALAKLLSAYNRFAINKGSKDFQIKTVEELQELINIGTLGNPSKFNSVEIEQDIGDGRIV